MKKIYPVFCLLMVIATLVNGQSENLHVINSSGGSSENTSYSIEWSIGELSSVNLMGAAEGRYILTNGFVQPLQASYTNFGMYVNSNNIRIYPNPTIDLLEIDFLQNISGTLTLQLSNSIGQVIYIKEIVITGFGYIEKINMKSYAKGNYSLHIQRIIPGSGLYDSQPFVYKIIKL